MRNHHSSARAQAAEFAHLAGRLSPTLSEYLDGYLVIGRRCGGGPGSSVQMLHAPDRVCSREEIEDLVILHAANILEERKRRKAAKRKR